MGCGKSCESRNLPRESNHTEEEKMAQIDQKAFTEGRIKHLMDSIDEHLDEETRIVLMESCGRACARSGPARRSRPGAAWR